MTASRRRLGGARGHDILVSGGVDSMLCTGIVGQIDVKFRRNMPFPSAAPAR